MQPQEQMQVGGGVMSAAIADADKGGEWSKGECMLQASKTSAYQERNDNKSTKRECVCICIRPWERIT